MENREKRDRGSNWNHAQTMALAELKRVNEEHGRLVWERIAQNLSRRFPDQIRTDDQCRRRWDTLVKVYNHIEDFCVVTGQDHRELDEGELDSMKLATAYHPDWYDIVEQVCSQVSQRKSKERCDDDPMPGKRSKKSCSVEHPEHPPSRDSLCSASTSISATFHEQSAPESTTSYAQVFCSPNIEVDRLSPEEEVPRLENGKDALRLEQSATTCAQVSSGPSFENDKLSPEEEVPRLKNGNAGLMLEQSATACAQASDSSPSLETDKLSPEDEVPRLEHGNDGLMLEQSTTAYAQVSSSPSFVLEATQLRQHGQVSHEVSQEPQTLESANLLPQTLAAENGAQLEEPLQPLAAENGAQLEEPLQTLAADPLQIFISNLDDESLQEPLRYGPLRYEPLGNEALRIALLRYEPLRIEALMRYEPVRLPPSERYSSESSWDFESGDWREESEEYPGDGSLWTFTAEGYWTETIDNDSTNDDDLTNDDELTKPRKSRLRSLKILLFFRRRRRLAIDCNGKTSEESFYFKKGEDPYDFYAASSISASSATSLYRSKGTQRISKHAVFDQERRRNHAQQS